MITALKRKVEHFLTRERVRPEPVDPDPVEGFMMNAEPPVRDMLRKYMANEAARVEYFERMRYQETEEELNDFDMPDDEGLPEISGLETVFLEDDLGPPEEEIELPPVETPQPEPPPAEPAPE